MWHKVLVTSWHVGSSRTRDWTHIYFIGRHILYHWATREDPPYSSTLAWKIPWTEEPGRLQSMGSLGQTRLRATSLLLSCIGEGSGNPIQCSCLENPRDGRAWSAAVYGVAQSRTRLKQLSRASSRSWWWSGKPGVLQSMGSQWAKHERVTEMNWTELNWTKWKEFVKAVELEAQIIFLLQLQPGRSWII